MIESACGEFTVHCSWFIVRRKKSDTDSATGGQVSRIYFVLRDAYIVCRQRNPPEADKFLDRIPPHRAADKFADYADFLGGKKFPSTDSGQGGWESFEC
jgi:hypothetical protein